MVPAVFGLLVDMPWMVGMLMPVFGSFGVAASVAPLVDFLAVAVGLWVVGATRDGSSFVPRVWFYAVLVCSIVVRGMFSVQHAASHVLAVIFVAACVEFLAAV